MAPGMPGQIDLPDKAVRDGIEPGQNQRRVSGDAGA
jgi:hypothetical protein